MTDSPLIAFCTTCKGRTQHIARTLPKNIAANADYPNCKFIVVDYHDSGELSRYLHLEHAQDIKSGKLVVYNYYGELNPHKPELTPFRMAHAKNMAHRCAILEGADILCNLDADNYTSDSNDGPYSDIGFASYISEQFEFAKSRKEPMFLRTVWSPGDFRRGVNGRIVVTTNAFLKAGGYDEKYKTWSPDDKDFNMRLLNLGYAEQEIDRQYIDSISHTDKMRFKEYAHARSRIVHYDNEKLLNNGDKRTVVNYGKFGMGIVFRNFSLPPITLGPLPTRIFGIGMHKTATTSLCKALDILGFESAHWVGPGWAKRIWHEMRDENKSNTLERYYALCDLPMTLLYKELDKAYPESKFILTVRDEGKWIKSVENHWDKNKNEFRDSWRGDFFTDWIHNRLYGRSSFDAETFLARYRQHNTEVKEYFKNRAGDLLTLDMEREWPPRWPILCKFVERPIPSVEYPREFATQ